MVGTTAYQTVQLVSAILTGIDHVVVFIATVVEQQKVVLVRTVQTTHVYTESGKNLEAHKSGDMTGGVVYTSPYLTVHQVSVILTGINRVVMSMENVVPEKRIVHARTVLTTHRKDGEMMESVEIDIRISIRISISISIYVYYIPFPTVQLLSAILMERTRVVVEMESAGTPRNTAIV